MNPFFPRPRDFLRSGNRGGFTLVEMIITLTVFVILSAAIFGIVSGVLQSASSLQQNQNRADETTALRTYLDSSLNELPGGSQLTSYRRGDGEGLGQNGIIFGTDNLLTAVDAQMQANGLYTLRTCTFATTGTDANSATKFTQLVCGNDPSLSWTGLLRDVKDISWHFQELNNAVWAEEWSNASHKPNLVEFTITLAGDLQPTTMEFWLPPVVPAPGQTIITPPS
jgi:prepilin-type N-terminal cleavage/methylation domain-containing protein